MRIQFRMNAGPHEIYTEQFASSLVGQKPRFNLRESEGGPVLRDFGRATVVAAEVIEDGRAVLVTYETPDGAFDLANAFSAGMARSLGDGFSFAPIPVEPSDPDWRPPKEKR